jgi:hypothetical protein
MTNTHEPPRRRGFLTWLGDLFRRRTPPLGVPVDVVVSEYRTGQPIEVPADGGVFHFTVHYDLTWSARGVSRATLSRWIELYQDSAERALRTAIWPIGRAHLPAQPEVAEAEMNDALRKGWCFGDAGEVVSCVAAVRVLADQRVLDRHLPLWEGFVELDLQYRVEHRRIDHVAELLARWRDLLDEFGDAPIVAQAAKLTDAQLAAAVEGLAHKRLALGNDLVAVLEKTRNAHGQVGLFELAKAYDVAVRTFERQAGLAPGAVSVGVHGDAA